MNGDYEDGQERNKEWQFANLRQPEFALVKKSQAHVAIPKQLTLIKEAKPRLIIDYMMLENFKSYANSQRIGNFHTNFTSVVGPNGSGKSNLIESMLFIFGYNARWMRLNRLNQLIHNSSSLTGVSKAAVEVHFRKILDNNNGPPTQIPGSKFFIRRTVNAASVSKYFMDGAESTQGEVKDRLKYQGIDLESDRFLILQGEVELISQMKQKSGDKDKPGLLQYLEEIIGSSQFIEQIQIAVDQYSKIDQIKHEKGEFLKLIEQQLKGMGKDKDEAIKYVRREKKVFQLQNVLIQVLMSNAKHSLKEAKHRFKDQQSMTQTIISEEREKLKKQAERVQNIKRNKQQIDQLDKKIQQLTDNMDKMNLADRNITNQIILKSKDQVRYKKQIQDSDKQFNKIIQTSQQLKTKLPQQTQKWKKMNQQVTSIKEILSKHDRPHLRQKMKSIDSQMKKYKIDKSTVENKINMLQNKLNKYSSNKEEQSEKIKQYMKKQLDSKQIYEKITTAQGFANEMINKQQLKLSQYKKRREQYELQLSKVELSLKQAQYEKQEGGMVNNMFKQIMKQKIPGVIGRLGDLGKTTKEYDQIITTCCSRLDNIVVSNYEAASEVVAFLKASRLGRSTCIILDKISEFRNYMAKPYTAPPHSVRLFDTISCSNEDIRVAFYFALSDTLYCANADTGLEYSMQRERRRVISKKPNGYIIYEINGLMVGTQPKRGGFDTKGGRKMGDSTKDLEKNKSQLQVKIEAIRRDISAEENAHHNAVQDVAQMKRQLTTITHNLQMQQEDIQQLKNFDNNPDIQNIKQNTVREIEATNKEMQKITIKIKKLEDEYHKTELEQSRDQSQQILQKRQMYKKKKEEFDAFDKIYEKERAILQTTGQRINETKLKKVKAEKHMTFLQTEISKLQKEQKEVQQMAVELIAKVAANNDKLAVCRKKEQQLSVILKEDENEVKVSKEKVDKARKDLELCKENIKKYQQQEHRNEQQLDSMREQYRKMTMNYDFMDWIEEVDKMVVGTQENKGNVTNEFTNSMLESSFIRESLDGSMNSNTKAFPIQRLNKIEPMQNLSQDKIDPFLIFVDRISSLVATEKAALKKMEGNNLQIINEYRNKHKQYKERYNELEAVKNRQIELKKNIDLMKNNRLIMFRDGFSTINCKLKEVYQFLTRGGDAQLQLIDSLDPFSDGVNFSVRPPKKSWKQVNKLSGGQKTLSSLSLIFALHYFKPTPLYFMDEIDAALDFKNVSIVADYIKRRTKDAQFIIISLRNNMFDRADKLIGAYKIQDKTRVINLDCSKINELKAKENNPNRNNF